MNLGGFEELDKLKYKNLRDLALRVCGSLEGETLLSLWLLIAESFRPAPGYSYFVTQHLCTEIHCRWVTSVKYYLSTGEMIVLGD
jgi:hypothetical protein